jgi:hypothetical protein
MFKSFLRLPSKILGDQLHLDYLIRSVYKERLLRSPDHSAFLYWRSFIKVNGIAEFIKQILMSQEKAALNAKIESQRIIFMHIQKTAGSSFRVFFERFTNNVYTFHAKENPCPAEKACLINGHFGFSFMKNVTYDHSFTILRDPIKRIISLYRFGISEMSGWESDDPVRILNFGEWISSEDPRVKSLIDSFYIRVITDDLAEPFESRITDSFKLALKRYSEFSAVGDQSNLKPFCQKVASLLDFPIFLMPLHNNAKHHALTNSKYPPRPKLTPEIQRRLGQLTRLDYEIYNQFRAK